MADVTFILIPAMFRTPKAIRVSLLGRKVQRRDIIVRRSGDCCFACPAESGHDVNTGNGYHGQQCEKSRD
jgi:hypothetical protein